MGLKNKIVLVTGASSGIGEAAAQLVAKKGAVVILQARNTGKLKLVSDSINKAGGRSLSYPVDLADLENTTRIAGSILNEVGAPDVIINCAGAGHWLSFLETSPEGFTEMMDAPYFATVNGIKPFLPTMVNRGSGHIITINSASCYFSYAGAIGYLSARWALRGFMDALHEELRNSGVQTTMLVAGKVDSPYFANNPGSEARIPKIATALTTTLTVNEVAEKIVAAIQSPKRTIIIPPMMTLFVWLNRYFPGIFRLLMRKTGWVPTKTGTVSK